MEYIIWSVYFQLFVGFVNMNQYAPRLSVTSTRKNLWNYKFGIKTGTIMTSRLYNSLRIYHNSYSYFCKYHLLTCLKILISLLQPNVHKYFLSLPQSLPQNTEAIFKIFHLKYSERFKQIRFRLQIKLLLC